MDLSSLMCAQSAAQHWNYELIDVESTHRL